jgi:hypothetical protein
MSTFSDMHKDLRYCCSCLCLGTGVGLNVYINKYRRKNKRRIKNKKLGIIRRQINTFGRYISI